MSSLNPIGCGEVKRTRSRPGNRADRVQQLRERRAALDGREFVPPVKIDDLAE